MPTPHYTAQRGNYIISTDPERLDVDVIYGYLSRSYWAQGRSREAVERSLHHSLCFGLYDGERQIGLVRVITDYATFAYLCDVFVLEEAQGSGLGTWMIEVMMEHPDLRTLRRMLLATRDAHGLYAKVGFTPLTRPEIWMEVFRSPKI